MLRIDFSLFAGIACERGLVLHDSESHPTNVLTCFENWVNERRGYKKKVTGYTFFELLYFHYVDSLVDNLVHFQTAGNEHVYDPAMLRALYDLIVKSPHGGYDGEAAADPELAAERWLKGDTPVSELLPVSTLNHSDIGLRTNLILQLARHLHGKGDGREADEWADAELAALVGDWDSVRGWHITPRRRPAEVWHKTFTECWIEPGVFIGCKFNHCRLLGAPTALVGCSMHNCLNEEDGYRVPKQWVARDSRHFCRVTYTGDYLDNPRELIGVNAQIVPIQRGVDFAR